MLSSIDRLTLFALRIAFLVCCVACHGAAAADEPHGASPVPRATNYKLHHGPAGWQLEAPDGKRFFSLGVCVLDQGTPRDKYNPANPSYAAWQHYDAPADWARATLGRLASWRFTTIGGWSDLRGLNSVEHSMHLTPVLHLGSTCGFPWWDMWDEKHLARMERLAVERIDPWRDDPRLIGYYSDNEMGWWNAALWRMTLEHAPTSGQRQRLIRLLREIYHDDWNALAADFIPQGASNWEELDRGGMLLHRPGSSGVRTMRRFLELVAERYYQLMRDAIRRHDPDALYLGDRYQSFYYPEVARTSGRFVDVSSTNLNASWNDGRFLRSYLDTLHQLTGKPILVSEFYMAAMENRSGNKNQSSGFPVVQTQAERAANAQTTLESLASLPYVVGAEWFQYYDEPPLGRGDGEDYNFGLVDVHDTPYDGLTQAFAAFDAAKFRAARTAPRVDARAGVPPAPTTPLADFGFWTALKSWDRQRGFVPPASDAPLADLYVGWSPEALYVGLYARDIVEAGYYDDGVVPEVDRALWTINVGDGPPITVRFGGGQEPILSDPALETAAISGLEHDNRLIAAVKIPASRLGKQRLTAGDRVTLHSMLITHARAYQFEWSADIPLAD